MKSLKALLAIDDTNAENRILSPTKHIVLLVGLLSLSLPAHAYVGPGLGLGVIGAILGGILAVFLAILGIFWYPIKSMLKKKKSTTEETEGEAPAPEQDAAKTQSRESN